MNKEDIQSFITIIKELGFPVFVSCWFMFRLDKKLDKILEVKMKLYDQINKKNKHD